jgi:hypothetical protein
MANSKLLKEAIADAKAVRETAIANAKIALEEAFTPRLQSILSKKLTAEMEGEDEEPMEEGDHSNEEEVEDEVAVEETVEVTTEAEEVESDEDSIEEGDGSIEDPTNADDATISDEDEFESDEEVEEDELDLESIIRELEMGMEDEDEISEEDEIESDEFESDEEDEIEDIASDEVESHEAEMHDDEEVSEDEDMDDEIDLEEILREMGYGDDEDVDELQEEEDEDKTAELEADLDEALKTVKSLQSTINEVNLLNAKLLYANRLFRGYNLTNEQKTKVVENLDRTSSVREVKLVYATLAESMNFTGTEKKTKRVVAESAASKPVASTAPKKDIISENTNNMANRFKELANIK